MKYSLSILFLFVWVCLNAQTVAIQHSKLQYVYPYIGNHMTIIAENVPCDSLHITSDNGVVKRDSYSDNPCTYVIAPRKMMDVNLKLFRISGKDTIAIGERRLRTRPWREQEARFGRIRNGSMSLGEFKATKGVVVPILNMDISGTLKVLDYEILVVRKEELVLELKNEGGRLLEENQKALEIVREGDLIIIDHIRIVFTRDEDERPTRLASLKFTIRKTYRKEPKGN